jgi:predicted transcriptional regulator
MPYDSSLDAQVFSRFFENDNGKIAVSIYSYNSGPKKLQIVREVKDRNGEFSFAKLGRLTKDEIEGVLPLIQEAIKNM